VIRSAPMDAAGCVQDLGQERDSLTGGSINMAQDSNNRAVRSDDPYDGDPAPGGRNSDPLAELARLIGQDDHFAAAGRRGARPSSQPGAAQPYDDDPQSTSEWLNRPGARGSEPGAGYDQPADSQDYAAGYDDPQYGRDPRYDDPQYNNQTYAADGSYDDGQYYGEEGYEEPKKRRGGLSSVMAVLGLAVVGTAGVFGYQALTSPATGTGEPPVIKAEPAPTKIVPATPASDDQLVKQQYDRVGDRGGERVVPREEQPVDPKALAPTMPTGSVLPPLTAPVQSAAAGPNEPKKVKTVPIRPDQPNQQFAAAPPSPPTARASPAPSATPTPTPAPAPTTRSLAPTAPARTAAAETGNYVVQVASQRSEADAQASFKALQQKYPSVLGSYQAVFRRADLGDRGVYYRAQVGPFATAEEANDMCSSLKSAGGQCIVQRN
jgi:SPOR domain